jgi:hypothetical protein
VGHADIGRLDGELFMMAEIRSGWVFGELPGLDGRTYRMEKHPRTDQSSVRLVRSRPNLVLHTTESPDLGERYRTWPYPPQLAVGDGRIVQLFPLWAQGKASKGQDAYAMQVEIAGYSKLGVWLPPMDSLGPLVALMAFLEAQEVVPTSTARPADWPTHVDFRPGGLPASDDYYRRKAGLWPDTPGVFGHLELPGDTHWDPGGLDYPRLFELVREVLGGEDDVQFDEWHAGFEAHEAGKDIKDTWSADKKDGWRDRNKLLKEAVALSAVEPKP